MVNASGALQYKESVDKEEAAEGRRIPSRARETGIASFSLVIVE
jgi:hypothetical protein